MKLGRELQLMRLSDTRSYARQVRAILSMEAYAEVTKLAASVEVYRAMQHFARLEREAAKRRQ